MGWSINSTCHILNRVSIRHVLKKTLYELYYERKPTISYFYVFSCTCFVFNNEKDNLEKWDAKSNEELFLGYSSKIKHIESLT